MNSSQSVAEIFTKAGEAFHKLADMTALLDTKQIKVQVAENNKTRNVSEWSWWI